MELSHLAVLLLAFGVPLVLGVPVAYALGLAAVATLVLSVPAGPAATTVAQRLAAGLDSFTLVAIPFFILAGRIMDRGGLARRLIDLAKALVGSLPGGLAFVNVVAAMLFGAVSGSAVAAASAIGAVLGPRMRDEGYPAEYAAAVNVSSATTGLVIPPSNVLIVYSLASGGTSIAALFLAGYLPGLVMGLALMAVAGALAMRHRHPRGERVALADVGRHLLAALPSLFLLVVVIGGIVGGVFTPTEAAAVAVAYAAILALLYREVGLRDFPGLLRDAAATSAVVMLLIGTSLALSWVLAFERLPQTMSAALLGLDGHPVLLLLAINAFLLAVGTFMDMTPAVLIFTPIFLPAVSGLGMDPVHFGILMVMNLCIGLCTPPVGSVLFVGCGVAGLPITRVVRPLLPFFVAMLAALLAVTFLPELSLWLPRALGY